MAQSLVLSIDVCRGLGISPLRINIWLSFSQADLGPTSAQECFFLFFFRKFGTFFSNSCAHSERCRGFMVGIFEIQTFFGNIAFPLSPVSAMIISNSRNQKNIQNSKFWKLFRWHRRYLPRKSTGPGGSPVDEICAPNCRRWGLGGLFLHQRAPHAGKTNRLHDQHKTRNQNERRIYK